MPSRNNEVKVIIRGEDRASGVLSKFGLNLKSLGIMAAGVFAISVGKKAVQGAADLEQALGNVSTLISGDAKPAIDAFRIKINELRKSMGVSAEELGASAYAIVSAGITDTSDAMKTLQESANLARSGLGTTEEATTLLVLAMNNFRDSGLKVDDVANIMFKTVKTGVTTVAELSRSFGLVAPLAVNAGISLQELQAATAALTAVNKSASISQNQIKAALVSLGKPTADAIKIFDQLGVKTFAGLIKKTGGMVEAFKAMKDATDGNSQAFAGAIGSGEALSGVLALLGPQSKTFSDTLNSMKSGTDEMSEAVAKQNAQYNVQYKILSENINVELQKLALKILPTLINIMVGLPDAIQKLFINPFKGVVEVLSDIMFWTEKVINSLTKLTQKAGSGIGKAFNKTKGFLGFASGGVVPGPIGSPIPAIVHGGETVIPVGGRGGGGSVVINISGNNFLNDEAAEVISNSIIDKLKMNMRI